MAHMPEQFKAYNNHFVDLNDDQAALDAAMNISICTDDQGMDGVRFGVQDAGAIYGNALDMDTAGYLDRGIQSDKVDFSADARTIAAHMRGTIHEKCAAIALAAAIDGYQANPDNAPALLEGSEKLAPGLVTPHDVEMMQERIGYRLDPKKGLYLPGQEVVDGLTQPDENGDSVEYLGLARPTGHIGTVMIGNDVPGTFYDTARAYDQSPAYGLTLHALGRQASMLAAPFPLKDKDNYLKATVLRSVAVAAHLPNSNKGNGGKGIDLAYRGRGLAEVA